MPTPDAGIKKVIIPKKSLPAIFGSDHKYIVRYRVVSEDRNRFSHWSAQHKIAAPAIDEINYSVIVEQDVNVVRLVWEKVENISDFDIYVRWDNSSWEFAGSTITNNYTGLIKNNVLSFQFAVQVPTFPKNRFATSTLFETEITEL